MFSGTPPRRKAPKVTQEESINTAAAAIAKAVTVASFQTLTHPRHKVLYKYQESLLEEQLKFGIKVKVNHWYWKNSQHGVLNQGKFDEQKVDGLRKL